METASCACLALPFRAPPRRAMPRHDCLAVPGFAGPSGPMPRLNGQATPSRTLPCPELPCDAATASPWHASHRLDTPRHAVTAVPRSDPPRHAEHPRPFRASTAMPCAAAPSCAPPRTAVQDMPLRPRPAPPRRYTPCRDGRALPRFALPSTDGLATPRLAALSKRRHDCLAALSRAPHTEPRPSLTAEPGRTAPGPATPRLAFLPRLAAPVPAQTCLALVCLDCRAKPRHSMLRPALTAMPRLASGCHDMPRRTGPKLPDYQGR